VDDHERAGGAGQGGVEAARPAVRALGEDRGRLDDQRGVELETLGHVRVEQVDRRAERSGGRVGEADLSQRHAHGGQEERGRDDADAADLACQPRRP